MLLQLLEGYQTGLGLLQVSLIISIITNIVILIVICSVVGWKLGTMIWENKQSKAKIEEVE